MEYTEAVNVIKANYNQSQATKMLNLHEGTVKILAQLCKEGTKKDLTDSTIDTYLWSLIGKWGGLSTLLWSS